MIIDTFFIEYRNKVIDNNLKNKYFLEKDVLFEKNNYICEKSYICMV